MTGSSLFFSLVATLIGAITGVVYLGFLWLSVKKFTRGNQPIFLTVFQFFLRLALVSLSLFWMAKWLQIQGVLFYLLGYFIVKKIAQRKRIYGYHN